jgi:hypothetical protein
MAVLKEEQTEKRNAREAGLSVQEKVASRKAAREAGGILSTSTHRGQGESLVPPYTRGSVSPSLSLKHATDVVFRGSDELSPGVCTSMSMHPDDIKAAGLSDLGSSTCCK